MIQPFSKKTFLEELLTVIVFSVLLVNFAISRILIYFIIHMLNPFPKFISLPPPRCLLYIMGLFISYYNSMPSFRIIFLPEKL